jgi:hypothetical protein
MNSEFEKFILSHSGCMGDKKKPKQRSNASASRTLREQRPSVPSTPEVDNSSDGEDLVVSDNESVISDYAPTVSSTTEGSDRGESEPTDDEYEYPVTQETGENKQDTSEKKTTDLTEMVTKLPEDVSNTDEDVTKMSSASEGPVVVKLKRSSFSSFISERIKIQFTTRRSRAT